MLTERKVRGGGGGGGGGVGRGGGGGDRRGGLQGRAHALLTGSFHISDGVYQRLAAELP